MESPWLAECPVCLQSYNSSDAVPRILPCGHTACETCLHHLPQKFPQTIRCPGCTQLVKFPSTQGPSSLPKNIDLLRLCDRIGVCERRPEEENHGNGLERPSNCKEQKTQKQLLPEFWSDELYATWKDWVLPAGALSVQDGGKVMIVGSIGSGSLSRRHRFMDNQAITLVPVFSLASGCEKGFMFSYTASIMNHLNKMEEDIINDLTLVLTLASGQHKVCEIYGLWGDIEAGVCYLVSKKLRRLVFENYSNLPNGFVGLNKDGVKEDAVSGFAMVALDICEIMISLHREKLIIGCLGLSCIDVDDFSHACVDLLEILLSGREVSAAVAECASGKKIVDNKDIGVIFHKLLLNGMFVSPEVLFALLKKKNVIIGDNVSTSFTIGYSSDVWTFGCVLVRLLIGTSFTEETWKTSNEESLDYSNMYLKWLENVSSLLETKLGSEFVKLRNILCECLNLDPRTRPLLTDVWKCMRELLTKHYLGNLENEDVIDQGADAHCLLLGKLCWIESEVSDPSEDVLHELGSETDDPAGEGGLDHDFVKNISQEKVKCMELRRHLDCVTALAIGGGFLFSTSYDKTVQVWSLQDFSHVHTFRGHENKIMAVAYVDGEPPLCVTGDGGGEIFVWSICSPFGNEPLKKWHEQKDWRYSGIHALAYSADNGHLYTGSGDKLIKAWSLQDCTLICSMEGHRSVVSSLRVHNGVLYSGSWDGTIRLWSLSDHSNLTVFGEDVPGKVASVLSITADGDLLVAAHENGSIKVWKNDTYMKSAQVHGGAIFSLAVEGKWLFTGGWDRTINIQEISGDEHHIDVRSVGSIPCESVITSLLSWNGKLFVGSADRSVRVYTGK